MRKWSVAAALAISAFMLVTVQGQQAGQLQQAQAPRGGAYVPDEVLVRFSPAVSTLSRNAAVSARGAARLRRFANIDVDHLKLPPGLSVAAAIAAFKSMPGVLIAQPNYTRRVIRSTPPNDPYWLDGSLWGLDKIQAHAAWTNFTAGDGSVIIASIDTGVDYTHPDLAANMWRNPFETAGNGIDDDGNGYVDDVYGIDTVNHDSDPIDDQGHGTHTSGTIAASGNNDEGVVGVNWNAKVLACKFLSAEGSGTDAGAIECFNYISALRARGENIRVTSNSWGQLRGSEPPSAALQAAIDAAGALGIINVFGAGNDGVNTDIEPFDPASYSSPSIIAVASSSPTDRRSFFSNYGEMSVDLAAPGEDILSTYPGGDYSYSSGTSMATPHVAGVAALLVKMDPTLSPEAIKALLMNNVDLSSKWTGKVASGGRLNAFLAAQAVGVSGNNEPPVVAITGPAEGATFKAPVTITLEAAASDSDGSIQRVTFYANGAPIGTDTSSPYNAVWNAPPGTYTLTAVALDDRYAAATSAGVHVFVADNDPPVVTITSPAEGAIFTSPASFTIDANAVDPDGTIQQVTFYANGVAIGTDTTSPYSASWSGPLGEYALTAIATDNVGGTGTSPVVTVTVSPIPGRINVALGSNGGTATASSTYGVNYPAFGAINGDHKGLLWGAGGGWNDGTQNASPDWLEVRFPGLKLIEEVSVFSMQDNYTAPIEPTPTMTFGYFGLKAFEIQYWDGAQWLQVPNGAATNNNLVWRKFVFTPLTTTKIRVFITAAQQGYSRMMEVEAFGIPAAGNIPPDILLTSPAAGAPFTAPAAITVSANASDSDGSIAQVEFFADGVSVGTDTTSPYSLTWSNVPQGTSSVTAVATDDQGGTTTSTAVSVSVAAPNAPPTVAITSPTEGTAFTSPATFTVTANAADSDGSIASVVFYMNGTAIGTDTTSPYSVTLADVLANGYTLMAIATDNIGATTTSAAVTIAVNQPPGRMNMALSANGGVALASSTSGPNYPASGAINGDHRGLLWGAGGGWNDGTQNVSPDWIEVRFAGFKTIDEVSVYSMQDNYSAPVEPTPAMTFIYWGLRAFEVQYWDGTAWLAVPGASVTNNNLVWRRFTFAPITTTRIRVFITQALNGYSRVMEVEAFGVPSGINAPPDVAITSPAPGATFTAPAAVTLNATATDGDGSIASVAFFANGTPIGTDTTSPYSVSWSGVAAGVYSLTAVATDNAGATTTSAPVSITVNPANVPPVVSVTSPAAGATFTSPANLTVTASATDSNGTVTSVAFFANGAPIGTDTTSPYSVAWNNVTAGSYALTAVATDNHGATTTSAAVNITVNLPAGRTNVALAVNGGVATASSTLNPNYPASAAINGDRRGIGWGAGGGWNDGTMNASPDWIEIAFNGAKTIDEINVFSMQDAYTAPIEPTLATTFNYFGLRAFEVQYWNGTAWVTVPGGSITNNNRVWRQVLFAPVTTTRIRVWVVQALNGYSRAIEVEAWSNGGS